MRILVANFFPAFHPPRSGGEQRYYYLYHYLSRNFDVTLLSPTYSNHAFEVVTFSPTLREHRVPKDQVFDGLHWKLGAEGIGPECSAYVVSLAAATDTQYGRRFEALVKDADLIIHESPFTFPYDRSLGTDGKTRIYDAYNVEHRLAAQILRGARGEKAVEFIRFLEKSLVDASSLVFATCEEERDLFVSDFGADPKKVALAPNGFEPIAADDAAAASPCTGSVDGKPYTVFMGSAHPPNVEAALFIVHQLAPAMPDVEFRLIGSVCSHLPDTVPRNVKSLGFVNEAEKRMQLEHCRAALNPLFSGAGTNLKMLDYMAAGASIVSTPIGARGLSMKHGVDAFIVTGDRYAETLCTVLHDRSSALSVGATAKRRAFAEYTWEHIAERVSSSIESVVFGRGVSSQSASMRPLLLVVNDFPVAQATGGGQVRIRALLTELGREFDVIFLCLTSDVQPFERILAPGVLEVGIPKTPDHRRAEVQAGHGAITSIDDITASQFCAANAALVDAFRTFADRSAAVVFEHPYLAPLLDFVPAKKPIIYSSLNVESDLKGALLSSRRDAALHVQLVKTLEKRLLDRADLVVCVSSADRARFVETHPGKRFEVIENGARIGSRDCPLADRSASSNPLRGRTLALFMGSAHMPNVEAVKFLLESVAPKVPEVTFGIIGSVCDAARLVPQPRNVVLFGILEEAEKNRVLALATFAVNPMLEGGGSSLKIPDFFAARLPLVSTRVGVRGYDLRDGEHYVAAERAEFVAKTRALARDEALRHRLTVNARAFAESALDWRVLGARYRRTLRSLVDPYAKRRALVVTYRFADPPPGGAETFLVNVLRELAQRGKVTVDVATCNVGSIANKWHFSAEYARPNRLMHDPTYVGRVFRFAVDAPLDGDFERCQRLFAIWMAESRIQAAMLPTQYTQPLLLGGWNFPESYAGKTARWTSREAQIYVGRRAIAISFAGFAPKRMAIEVLRGGTHVATRDVNGRFEWSLELPGNDDSVVVLRSEQVFSVNGDPRELGFIVHEISVREGTESHPVDLAGDFGTAARRLEPQLWVKSLIEVTERRDRSDDDLFIAVRGPHSAELRRWLEDNVASYDVVLAQGVPFSTPVVVTEIAARQGVPVVLLPHFHMEDRYYHWRQYYEMFRRAQCVIVAPTQAKSMFFDVVGANSALAPGGGVDLREYDASGLRARQQAFLARHTGTKPFVLVLGRKAGGKNYQMAIDATLVLNADNHRVDLVLIGPDDDGIPVTEPNTYYYGAQSRDVVLGALSLALCLVNMSESESFGIVLLETWLAGRPVVAQRKCMAFADLVVSGENGFLVESQTEIARAVECYLLDEGLAAKHAERGRAIAEQHSWANVAERVESILLDAAQATLTRAEARRDDV
jgi:glycosyltransferase involved in cell wall biosynthesis